MRDWLQGGHTCAAGKAACSHVLLSLHGSTGKASCYSRAAYCCHVTANPQAVGCMLHPVQRCQAAA